VSDDEPDDDRVLDFPATGGGLLYLHERLLSMGGDLGGLQRLCREGHERRLDQNAAEVRQLRADYAQQIAALTDRTSVESMRLQLRYHAEALGMAHKEFAECVKGGGAAAVFGPRWQEVVSGRAQQVAQLIAKLSDYAFITHCLANTNGYYMVEPPEVERARELVQFMRAVFHGVLPIPKSAHSSAPAAYKTYDEKLQHAIEVAMSKYAPCRDDGTLFSKKKLDPKPSCAACNRPLYRSGAGGADEDELGHGNQENHSPTTGRGAGRGGGDYRATQQQANKSVHVPHDHNPAAGRLVATNPQPTGHRRSGGGFKMPRSQSAVQLPESGSDLAAQDSKRGVLASGANARPLSASINGQGAAGMASSAALAAMDKSTRQQNRPRSAQPARQAFTTDHAGGASTAAGAMRPQMAVHLPRPHAREDQDA
jgi:hypothetical protein